MKIECKHCTLFRPGHDGVCDSCRANLSTQEPIKWRPGITFSWADIVKHTEQSMADGYAASFAPVSIGGPDVWPASSMQADRYAAACRLSPITQADRIFPVGNIDPSWFNSIFPDYILAGIAEAPDKIAIDPLAGLTRTLK